MESLADALPKELSRVREILGYYKEIGAPGVIGAMLIEEALRNAEKAIISGDVVQMIAAYKDLQSVSA